MKSYDHKTIEEKWRKKWFESMIYEPDIKSAKTPFYNLMMFPYPSAEGLHVGSVFTFSGIDVYGRFQRMQGNDVFEPIGLDAFGIHSENYALKTNTHPMDLSKRTEENFYRQLHEIGNGFAWSHKLETNKPNYYKWTQWLFLQLYKKGLAVQKEAPVNWCPSCLTVLSDEQVIAGRCERCDSEVEIKQLKQWFFKITEYAERLLNNLDWIDWESSVKTMQRNWIGKKTGAEIDFRLDDMPNDYIKVFTTRPDTLFGATALVLAPEHPLVQKISTTREGINIAEYIKKAANKTEVERQTEGQVKTGVKTSLNVIHPLTNEAIPVYIADYIIGSYGTGAIMLVPAHDQRDLEFAKVFDIPIKVVVKTKEAKIAGSQTATASDNQNTAFTDYGVIINSGKYDGLTSEKASEMVVKDLDAKHLGKMQTTYHLRDWLISRQRYWGPPIPIIYCPKCGTVPVPEDQLPVELPYIKDFRPTGTGKSPLATHPEFYNTTCPKCGGKATRETDVSDTFLDSSWYFLRYASTDFDDVPFDDEITKKWLPVDMYIGGKEHTVLHLLYSRFITMVLHDLGLLDFEEPYKTFRANGLIIKEGAKMSKSKGNVTNPDEYIEKYGADTLRAYLLFLGPFQQGGDFRDSGIAGMQRFLNRVWHYFQTANVADEEPNGEEAYILSKTIKKVTEDIKLLHYNTAIASIMELVNFLTKAKTVSKKSQVVLLQLLAPFCPFMTEELWSQLGQPSSIHTSQWPTFDEKDLVKEELLITIQINGKVRDHVAVNAAIDQKGLEQIILKRDKVKTYTNGKVPKKIIYVPGRLVNIVV